MDILDKIEDGSVTAEDFNKLIKESMPESIRNRIRRRMKVGKERHSRDGKSTVGDVKFAARVQPRRDNNDHKTVGRGKSSRKKSSKTIRRKYAKEEILQILDGHISEEVMATIKDLL